MIMNSAMSIQYPTIDPVAFAVGPLMIRWYALAYLAGFLLGWWYARYITKLQGCERPNKDDIDDYLSWAIVGVLLGGRLGYVLFYQTHVYLENPMEILKLWHGGMSFHGGVVGVVSSLLLFAWIKKVRVLRIADVASCAAPIGVFLGRIANFVNGELFGKVSNVPWAMVFPHGGPDPRHPSQLYESFLEGFCLFALLAIALHVKGLRERPGFLSGTFLAGYGGFRAIAEIFREPDFYLGPVLGELSMGQVLSVPMIIAGIYLMVRAFRKPMAA